MYTQSDTELIVYITYEAQANDTRFDWFGIGVTVVDKRGVDGTKGGGAADDDDGFAAYGFVAAADDDDTFGALGCGGTAYVDVEVDTGVAAVDDDVALTTLGGGGGWNTVVPAATRDDDDVFVVVGCGWIPYDDIGFGDVGFDWP